VVDALGRNGRTRDGTCSVVVARLHRTVAILVEVCFGSIDARRCLAPVGEASRRPRRSHRIRQGDGVQIYVNDVRRRHGSGALVGRRDIGSYYVRVACVVGSCLDVQ
jgi:hypothetical protein